MPSPRSLSIHGMQASRERNAEVLRREIRVAQDARRPRGRCRGSPTPGRRAAPCAARCASPICTQQLAHVLRAGAGRRLVGHAGHPLDEVVAEQPGERHHHQAHRAVAADVVLHALRERGVDHVAVDRVEDDHRVVLHPQRRRGVDPVALPAGRAQLRKHVVRVVAALAGDDRIERGERGEVGRALERRRVPADGRALAADVRRREEHGLDQLEVPLLEHPLHQHRAHHSTPTDESCTHDRSLSR